jgi:hypothetical protein
MSLTKDISKAEQEKREEVSDQALICQVVKLIEWYVGLDVQPYA